MVGPGMLCVNGWSVWGRYHGCHTDALRERMEFVRTLSWLAHGCSVGMEFDPDNGATLSARCRHSNSAKYRKYQRLRGLHARACASPKNARGGAFSAAKSMKHGKCRCGGPVRGVREQHVGA